MALRLAADQYGVVARFQLTQLGLSEAGVDRWIRTGRLIQVHRGVFALGHPRLTVLGRWSAGLLAAGWRRDRAPAVALSHRSAAAAWELLPPARPVEVLRSTGRHVRRLEHLTIRSAPGIEATDLAEKRGLPLTGPARTLADLATLVPPALLEDAVSAASRHRLVTPVAVHRSLLLCKGRPGAATLRALLEDWHPQEMRTRSALEGRFLRLCRREGIPSPLVNAQVDGFEVDFLWPAAKLVVEMDGYAYHSSRQAFERDRERDRRLSAAGFRVLRLTSRMLRADPSGIAATVKRQLPVR